MADRRSANLIGNPAFRREVDSLHKLGPRITGELLAELIRHHGPDVRATLATFAALDPGILAGLGALLWPPLPLHAVQVAA
jgi:hypothetical protein